LLPYILFEKYIDILALEMVSTGNQLCADSIGILSFSVFTDRVSGKKQCDRSCPSVRLFPLWIVDQLALDLDFWMRMAMTTARRGLKVRSYVEVKG